MFDAANRSAHLAAPSLPSRILRSRKQDAILLDGSLPAAIPIKLLRSSLLFIACNGIHSLSANAARPLAAVLYKPILFAFFAEVAESKSTTFAFPGETVEHAPIRRGSKFHVPGSRVVAADLAHELGPRSFLPMNKNPIFLCRDCGHEGKDEDFGLWPRCPQCRSHRVVRADIWRRVDSK